MNMAFSVRQFSVSAKMTTYSSDLTPSDFFLLSRMKGKRMADVDDVKHNVTVTLTGIKEDEMKGVSNNEINVWTSANGQYYQEDWSCIWKNKVHDFLKIFCFLGPPRNLNGMRNNQYFIGVCKGQ